MTVKGIMLILMLVVLCLVLPFTISLYGTPAFTEGGWVHERSSFVTVGFTESVLLPVCLWYLPFMVVMLVIPDEEKKLNTKSIREGAR